MIISRSRNKSKRNTKGLCSKLRDSRGSKMASKLIQKGVKLPMRLKIKRRASQIRSASRILQAVTLINERKVKAKAHLLNFR